MWRLGWFAEDRRRLFSRRDAAEINVSIFSRRPCFWKAGPSFTMHYSATPVAKKRPPRPVISRKCLIEIREFGRKRYYFKER